LGLPQDCTFLSHLPSLLSLDQLCNRIQQELLVEIAFREIGIRASLETAIAIGSLRERCHQDNWEILVLRVFADLGGEF
jgi:hypothetical protein